MQKIPLTQGKVALVDDEDFAKLSQYKWQTTTIMKKSGPVFYATRMSSLLDGPRQRIYMHRELMQPPKGQIVDHIDFDGLNNTRTNLRICSYCNNNSHRQKTTKKTHSKYRGVTWTGKRWMAHIGFNGNKATLGYAHTEEEAALLYDVGAQLLHGEFANLNGI